MNVLVTGSASGFAQPFISPAHSSTARADITIDEQYARGAVPGCAAAEALQAVEAWLDVVEAILRALHSKVRGAFNLACNESVTLTALHQQARWLPVPMAAHLLAHRLDTAREIIRHR
jgi:hypothetical protein